MKKLLLAAALLIPGIANAGTLTAVFQTEPGDTGGFLHVGMEPCADNEYEHLGKPIVWAMEDRGNGK